jgi:hypothetical protein
MKRHPANGEKLNSVTFSYITLATINDILCKFNFSVEFGSSQKQRRKNLD